MKRYLILTAMIACLLSGCSLFQQQNYISISTHHEKSVGDISKNVSVSSYSELEEVLLGFVEDGTEEALLSVANYDQQVLETHLLSVINGITQYNPVGAYAVDEIQYELGTSGGQPAVSLAIHYIHDRSEIRQIRQAKNTERACVLMKAALDNVDAGIVVRIQDYDPVDFTQMVEDYVDAYPDRIIERPEVSVAIYPDNGLDDQIVELKFTYQTSRNTLRSMQKQVKDIFESAQLYVSGDGLDRQKLTQLYSFLTERFEYQFETSITPAYSLLQHGVGDSKAFAVVYAAMCRTSGLDCQVVSGTWEGESHYWNVVKDGERYYHVDLLRCMEYGGFQEKTDGEMSGYVWDYSSVPDCVDDPITVIPLQTSQPTEKQDEDRTVSDTTEAES